MSKLEIFGEYFEEGNINKEEDMNNETTNIKNEVLKIINLSAYPDVGKLAFRYRLSLTQQETAIELLWTFLRAEKQGDKYVPFLLPECAKSLEDISEASAKLAQVKEDYAELKRLFGEYHSIRELSEVKRRHQVKLENVDYASRVVLEKALINNRDLSAQEVENLEAVRKQELKAKLIHEESDGVISDIQGRLNQIQKILGKY